MKLSMVKVAVLTVFRNPRYIAGAIVLALAFFFGFIIANNFPFFLSSASEWAQNPLLLGGYLLFLARMILVNSGIIALASIGVVSVTAAINICMTIYWARATRKSSSRHATGKGFSLSFGGVFGGALSSSCPACSSALISLLGVSGGLAIFPLKGLEISLASALILLGSVYLISRSLVECSACGPAGTT